MKVKRKEFRGVLSIVLITVLLLGNRSYGMAAEAGAEVTELPDTEGLELHKTLLLQEDGTYKITMEAYATGETEVLQVLETVPLDIVLVLDQSGSMSETIGGGTITTVTGYDRKWNNSSRNLSTIYNNRNNLYYKDGENYYPVTVTRSVGYDRNYYYIVTYQKDGQTVTVYPRQKNASVDVSGFYVPHTTTVTVPEKIRLEALRDSVKSFVDMVQKNSIDNEVQHRIAIAGFASQGFHNTEILTGCTINTANPIKDDNSQYYPEGEAYNGVSYLSNGYEGAAKNALQDVSTITGYHNVKSAVTYLTAHGGTETGQGMHMAKDIIDNRTVTTYLDKAGQTRNRQTIVVLFTDGVPTGSSNTFNVDVANAAISTAQELKAPSDSEEDKTLIYTIGIFDGADESTVPNWSSGPNASEKAKANRFMHLVSSNYPNALSVNRDNGSGDRAEDSQFYKTAADAGKLEDIFKSIATNVSTSTSLVPLDQTAVLKDTISQYFDVEEIGKVHAYTLEGTTTDDEHYQWGTTKTEMAEGLVSLKEKTVEVTGFDYKNDYIAAGHPGKKLVVEVLVTANESASEKGIVPSNVGPEADTDPVTGKIALTSGNGAGIYAVDAATGNRTAAEYFPVPYAEISANAYVLDFGKSVSIDQTEYPKIGNFVGMNQETMKSHSTEGITGTYGKVELKPDLGKAFRYTPSTFKWNGMDRIYGFGMLTQEEQARQGQTYGWTQTKFIPATSVYYEDDFGSGVSTDGSVNIVYTGDWSQAYTEDTTTGEQSYLEHADAGKDNYGFDEVYSNDAGYSNGSAHVINGEESLKKNGSHAVAEFTFTGTGVDIYSRTNMDSGQIMAEVYRCHEDGTVEETAQALKIVDNLYQSGDLYQIPTLAIYLDQPEYGNTGYGTYKVILTVSGNVTALTETPRSTYYLDGIRVYHPMGVSGVVPEGEDASVYYSEDGELNPLTVEFRDVLLNGENAANAVTSTTEIEGAVFIDQLSETLSNLQEYLTTFQNYGPKNEVYLTKGNIVAFKINRDKISEYGTDNSKIMLGMKAPEGSGTIKINEREFAFSTATDMYYDITEEVGEDGLVKIECTSESIMALTKIKVTNTASGLRGFIVSDWTLEPFIMGSTEKVQEKIAAEKVLLKAVPETELFTGNLIIASTEDTEKETAEVRSTIWQQLAGNVERYLGNQ